MTRPAEQLCLACGLCCDGSLFKDVELKSADDPGRLRDLGLPLKKSRCHRQVLLFAQPCAALKPDLRCRVYGEHPAHCRDFECALLLSVQARALPAATALRTIRQTRRRADTVRRLLRELGNHDEHLPLLRRFRHLKRRIEARELPDERDCVMLPDADAVVDRFADLTMAMHELQVALRLAFYTEPGP